MRALYNFLKSMKLAVTLILILTLLSLLSTLIPQGEALETYYQRYPQALAWLIVNTGFHNFFRSLIFLFPAALFLINLTVCTYNRFYTRLKTGAKKRYGPDILHVGLILLFVGSIVTFAGRREGAAYLGEGDEQELPDGYLLKLESYEFFTYEDGRPRDWISTVDVERGGELIVDSFSIEVNNPLKLGKWTVYQADYSQDNRAVFKDQDGQEHAVSGRRGFRADNYLYYFGGVEADRVNPDRKLAVFEKWEGHTRIGVFKLGIGEKMDRFTLASLTSRDLTGLQVVTDPGYLPFVIAAVLITLGLSLTIVQKIGDKDI